MNEINKWRDRSRRERPTRSPRLAPWRSTADDNDRRPAEMRVGDSLVMVSQAGERERFPAFLYVYVDDADLAYDRAVAAGAVTLEEPLDTPYGDRRAMVRDRSGNIFQIAHRQITA